MSDLNFLSAAEMARRIRKRQVSPVELVDAHLFQIERLNPKLNAFIQVDADRARKAALDAESAVMSGAALGALHGVPISIESSFGGGRVRCECGTRLRAGFVGRQDSVLVTRLKGAGAIVLGTTNTP